MILVAKGTIHSRVSEILGRKRMSIADLARKAEFSYQTAHALYHGKTEIIRFDTIASLCDVLDVGVGELFDYIPPGKNGDG